MRTVEEMLAAKGPDVIVAPPEASVLEAAKLMAQARVGSVVVQQDGQALGIFTEQDLLRRIVVVKKEPAATRLSDVMSAPVQTCRLADDLDTCARQMSRKNVRHLAVVEDNTLLGLISLWDILLDRVATQPTPVQTEPKK